MTALANGVPATAVPAGKVGDGDGVGLAPGVGLGLGAGATGASATGCVAAPSSPLQAAAAVSAMATNAIR